METNWLAVIVAAISTLVVGFIWYNPKTFANAWMQSAGITVEDAKKSNPALQFGGTVLVAILAALFLDWVVNHDGPEFQTFHHGVYQGARVGLMIALPVVVTNALFEQRNWKYMLINSGYWIVCFALMGGILCAWH